MAIVNITGIDKAKLLHALYDAAEDTEHFTDAPAPFTIDAATRLLTNRSQRNINFQFAVVAGRRLDIDISGNELQGEAYDAAHGEGLCGRVVEQLRAQS